ncbi:hypothetical protein D0865_05283 [Hortaea werneckii]|uniref:Uncharacterized protein n=1 Tax=Hortaea werneckii TaxID=91943 RepID=A0A3M7CMQ3_HORWE|nr:hypothetical protein D0865_05283 [Hortaea werneckii]
MSNTEQDKQRSEQVEQDDEPDDWWVVGWRGFEWIAPQWLMTGQGQANLQHWLFRPEELMMLDR